MADVRDIFNLPVDEDFVEHPTLNHFVAYIQRMTGGEATSAPVVTAWLLNRLLPLLQKLQHLLLQYRLQIVVKFNQN